MVENEVTAYIDPPSNFGFKRIFSSEPNKALLIAFLNKSCQGKKHIIDLVCNQIEYPGKYKDYISPKRGNKY